MSEENEDSFRWASEAGNQRQSSTEQRERLQHREELMELFL